MIPSADRVGELHAAYIAAAGRAVAVFEPLKAAFEAALDECLTIQERHGVDAPETVAARERVREKMRAAIASPGSDLAAAFDAVDIARHQLRAATLGTTHSSRT